MDRPFVTQNNSPTEAPDGARGVVGHMAAKARMEFGYNPPAGDRGLEIIVPRDYLGDLHHSLDVASQGFSSLWVSDHLNYADEWRIECWTLLTWIAARYPGPELGTIVMSNSFRQPSILAKMAASLHEMSSGRFILGYGAGWHEGEHKAYGLEYPSPRERIEMFEEGVQIIKTMWTDSPASFSGKHYTIKNAYSEPRPDPLPPLMLGGGDRKSTRLNSSHQIISYAVFCLKKKNLIKCKTFFFKNKISYIPFMNNYIFF